MVVHRHYGWQFKLQRTMFGGHMYVDSFLHTHCSAFDYHLSKAGGMHWYKGRFQLEHRLSKTQLVHLLTQCGVHDIDIVPVQFEGEYVAHREHELMGGPWSETLRQ